MSPIVETQTHNTCSKRLRFWLYCNHEKAILSPDSVTTVSLYHSQLIIYMWQTRVEIQYYSVVYFDHVTVLKVQNFHWGGGGGGGGLIHDA